MGDRTSRTRGVRHRTWPKAIIFGADEDERIEAWLTAQGAPGGSVAAHFRTLVLAGLEAVTGRSKMGAGSALHRQVLVDIQSILQAATDLDEAPHPRPRGVDPQVWTDREADRVRQVREHQARALTDAERMAREALGS